MIHERDVVVADGRTIRTACVGPRDGRVVIWHHGNPGSRVPPLPEPPGVRIISFDRPGGGGSTPRPGRRVSDVAEDVAAVADAWGVERCVTAGVSGGGAHALATAALLPELVAAAASLGGAAPVDADGLAFTDGMTDTNRSAAEEQPRDRASELAEMEPVRAAILENPLAVLLRFAEEFPSADRAALDDPAVADPIAEGMGECLRVSGEGWLDDSIAFSSPWGFDPASIRTHVEIWHGRDDTASPVAHARWLAARIPGAELRELDGGHYAPLLRLPEILARLAARA